MTAQIKTKICENCGEEYKTHPKDSRSKYCWKPECRKNAVASAATYWKQKNYQYPSEELLLKKKKVKKAKRFCKRCGVGLPEGRYYYCNDCHPIVSKTVAHDCIYGGCDENWGSEKLLTTPK